MNYQLQAPPPKKGVFSAFSCGTDRTGSFEVDFDKAPTGLYVLVHNKQWKGALDRLKHYPKEASTWIVRMGNEEGDVVPDTSATSRSQLRVTDARKTPKAATTEQIGGAMQSPSQMGKKVLRWRMLPLHAAVLFNAPVDLIQALLKAYPDACSKYDDQGMLPLHLAFRSGANEETILQLLDVYPNAIEQYDFKGRLPSMLAPKNSMTYGDLIGEAYLKSHSHYYWAARVATSDRIRIETAMTAKIKELEQSNRAIEAEGQKALETSQLKHAEQIEAMSVENVQLKEQLDYYQTTYDGAEEREQALVSHTNSLAERLKLTSLSETHLATKLAKLEKELTSKEDELQKINELSREGMAELEVRLQEEKNKVSLLENKAERLRESLEKKVMEAKSMEVKYQDERKLFEKQFEATKECILELMASSKEDKRKYEHQVEVLKRGHEEVSRSLEERIERLQMHVDDTRSHLGANSPQSLVEVRGRADAKVETEEKPETHGCEIDTYVSTKRSGVVNSSSRESEQARDDVTTFSHESDLPSAVAIGKLTDQQRRDLETLDLDVPKEELKATLRKINGLTEVQIEIIAEAAMGL
ncbi:hypothetical protein THAOC_29138 [Thalassiosira oceanica]|uniref:Uncharacterized protein n=1 Tax=Thalassiosira oceanica TaxID=159749 RepID=K0RS08_THAOC|nr:hypothetical protein THAOC_29138 [Thalassiosira oceanica]|mmetsp:Transcript_21483/g.47746  ORF Transcript_21483/g.47746 Transcript_21483/m.47746 type:complete len:586 (+) Transcript_21483:118-1875(+)|eukprot:EJK51671.1 hypothetical protein THAOC_29138 [Thalassiosira oceanica]